MNMYVLFLIFILLSLINGIVFLLCLCFYFMMICVRCASNVILQATIKRRGMLASM